ncbi:hypothetical protein FIU94_16675 [Sulfitobacter sp. THAF37]|nr:hypothetical protein FIU94_16675 [Sulfitobacter sp. THAF37]
MSVGNELARNLFAQEPGRVDCHANAANTQMIPQQKSARHNGSNRLQIHYLRRLHGVTEAQAHVLAALIWGAL